MFLVCVLGECDVSSCYQSVVCIGCMELNGGSMHINLCKFYPFRYGTTKKGFSDHSKLRGSKWSYMFWSRDSPSMTNSPLNSLSAST